MQLAVDEYEAILAALESVAGAQDATEYAARVSAGLYRLLPCQGVSCTEVDLVQRKVVSEPAPPHPPGWIAQHGPPFEQWAWQHPLFSRLDPGVRIGPLVWSIDGPQAAFAQTDLYRAFYAPHDVVSQVVFVFPTERRTSIVITVDCAPHRMCGERELMILTTMAPLLEYSYRLVTRAGGGAGSGDDRPGADRASAARDPRAPLRAQEVLRAEGLTARQAEIALMVASGASTAQIACALGISPATVRKHLESVHATLGVASRAAVAAAVMRLVHPETATLLRDSSTR